MRKLLATSESHYPVASYFNALKGQGILRALKSFETGHGYNPEDHTCDFPADLTEEEGGPEERFGYVEF